MRDSRSPSPRIAMCIAHMDFHAADAVGKAAVGKGGLRRAVALDGLIIMLGQISMLTQMADGHGGAQRVA